MREVHRAIADQVLFERPLRGMVRARPRARAWTATGKQRRRRRRRARRASPAPSTSRSSATSVTVYESRPAAGGMLRYALPEYRLPKRRARHGDRAHRAHGRASSASTSTSASDLTLNEIAPAVRRCLPRPSARGRSVGLPARARSSRASSPRCPSSRRSSREAAGPDRASKVVVIGGGNAAIDSARTALRLGADVTVVYRRERKDMPAIPRRSRPPSTRARRSSYLAAPHRIVGDADGRVLALEAVRTRPGEFDTSGRRRPVPTDEIVRFECDTVDPGRRRDGRPRLLRGLRPEGQGDRHPRGRPLLAGDQPRPLLRRRRPHHRRLQRLQRHGLGKKAARNIDRRLTGREDAASLFPDFESTRWWRRDPPSESAATSPGSCRPALRVQSNAEVTLGLGVRGRTGGDVPLPALRHPQRRAR